MNKKRVTRSFDGSVSKYTRANKSGTITRHRWQLWIPETPGDPNSALKRVGAGGYGTREEAQDALSDARRDHESINTRKAPLFGPYADQWIEGLRLAASTIAGYKRSLKHITPTFGKRALDTITPSDISRLYAQLEKTGRIDSKHKGEGLSANTIAKIHVTLSQILESAVVDGWIRSNPAKAPTVKSPSRKQVRAAKKEIRVWTAAQLRAFLEWDRNVYDDDFYTMWATIAGTGLRRSEVLALQWQDITGNRISVRRALDTEARDSLKTPKSGHSRVIDIDDGLTATLAAWRSLRAEISLDYARGEALVFGNLGGGTRSPNEVSRRWRTRVTRAQQDIDVPTITLHEVRHTHATLLLQVGVHPRVVQERLGHATIDITMNTYSHVLPTMQEDAVQRLSVLMQGEK